MLQPYARSSKTCDSTCNVHKRGANKTVRAAHGAADAALAAAGLSVTWCQEWPIRHGLRERDVKWIDLVFQLGARLYGIEVHGGKEHVHQPARRKKDQQKERLWLREHGTALIVVHSPKNLRLLYGQQQPHWVDHVQERVLAAVRV